MPASPIIVLPYPSQIAAGQPLDANAVQQDLVSIASAYNNHGHSASDVTGIPSLMASFLPVASIARVVKGIVSTGGTSLVGTANFVASPHPVTAGAYNIVFPSAFASPPIIIGAVVADTGITPGQVTSGSVTASSAMIFTYSSASADTKKFVFRAEEVL